MPENKPYTIRKFRAFIAVDKDGNEGLAAWLNGLVWTPLIACDERRYALCVEKAQEIADESGRPIHVMDFTNCTQVDVIKPKK
jgi:hypothetical protein